MEKQESVFLHVLGRGRDTKQNKNGKFYLFGTFLWGNVQFNPVSKVLPSQNCLGDKVSLGSGVDSTLS